jgi:molecular chaperone GrpE (heat shock protein)
MSEHDHDPSEPRREDRPRVKVTDRRRVHMDDRERDRTEAPSGPDEAAGPGGAPSGEAAPAEVVPRPGDGGGSPDELETARRQADEYLDHLQRLKAEFDNYRKRVLKEQTRAVEMASEPLIRRLLEVLDEFDLALMHAEQKPEFERFLHGVELVYAKLKDILSSEGLQVIDARGKPFDPERHEALMQSGGGDGEPVVVDVLRPGYVMKGRVIRPAGVKVGRK